MKKEMRYSRKVRLEKRRRRAVNFILKHDTNNPAKNALLNREAMFRESHQWREAT
jgi:hypothetical protein